MSLPYFAYGSNLSREHWAHWSQSMGFPPDGLVPLEAAVLPDHRLAFNYFSRTHQAGAANIVSAPGEGVVGYLFAPTLPTWAALDRKEGHPHVYRREERVVLTASGREVRALTYVVTPAHERPHTPPSEAYLSRIRVGYEDCGLGASLARLEALASDQPAPPDVAGVFVYGTLRAHRSNAAVLDAFGVQRRRAARVIGRLWDFGDWPGAVFWPPGDGEVVGEVVVLSALASAIPVLDRLEEFPGWQVRGGTYRRTLVEAHGQRWWAYQIQSVRDGTWVEDGDWAGSGGER